MTVTMFEAKTRLSKLVAQARNGEEVIITSGRARTPVAILQPFRPKKIQRLGLFRIPNYVPSPDFWDPMPEEELKLWEGGD